MYLACEKITLRWAALVSPLFSVAHLQDLIILQFFLQTIRCGYTMLITLHFLYVTRQTQYLHKVRDGKTN